MATTVGLARGIGADWVAAHAAGLPGFAGAFLTGSSCHLPAAAILPATSDVDVNVVVDRAEAPPRLGKLHHLGVTIDVSFRTVGDVADPTRVLADPHLAAALSTPHVVADRRDAGTRAADGRRRVPAAHMGAPPEPSRGRRDRERLAVVDAQMPFVDQVAGWVFPTGIMAHATPVAPTTTLPIATDVSTAARSAVIAGSAELIAAGDHRAAVFWIVATYAKCLIVLDRGAATDVAARHRGGFHDLLDDLGVRHPRLYGTVGVPRAPTFRACGGSRST